MISWKTKRLRSMAKAEQASAGTGWRLAVQQPDAPVVRFERDDWPGEWDLGVELVYRGTVEQVRAALPPEGEVELWRLNRGR